jgi:hypothetical protein
MLGVTVPDGFRGRFTSVPSGKEFSPAMRIFRS